MPELPEISSEARIVAANLQVDSVTAEVLQGFRAARVDSLLIKGASISRWLHDNRDPRSYGDCDLLVRPADLERAERVLRALGFLPEIDRRKMPGWWQEHAVAWFRSGDDAAVDLHRTLPGVAVDAERLWLVLSNSSVPIAVGGFDAMGLSIPARLLLLALHAANHGVGWGRVLIDLERGLANTEQETWEAAVELAQSLKAMPAFTTALSLIPEGRAVVAELGLPSTAPADVLLKANNPAAVANGIALGFEQLAQASGIRERMVIFRYKLAPPVTFIVHWWPLARRGRLWLAVAYVWRPLWILSKAPAGFLAWRAARRIW